jgi:hypothetical protein
MIEGYQYCKMIFKTFKYVIIGAINQSIKRVEKILMILLLKKKK